MSRRVKMTEDILKMMQDREQIRNIGLVGHIDHGKTTLSDSLIAEAGLLSESLAGEARVLDYLEEEQRRGITMKSANISLYYEHSLKADKPFLINLVDTPGHLDFTGKVTRALRLIDGVIVIVDAVEEVSSQTETVLRQSLTEMARPLLYINKIDRLFKELKLDMGQIKEKISRIIQDFNHLIYVYADEEFKDSWQVSAEKGSVIFGSALHRWGFVIPQLLKNKHTLEHFYDAYYAGTYKDLYKEYPVWEAVLASVVSFLPNPMKAQKYRMKAIWSGDIASESGQAMINLDSAGPTIVCICKVENVKGRLIATGRVFSGSLKKGMQMWLVGQKQKAPLNQLSIFMGSRMESVVEIPAGNIAAIGGFQYIRSGETLFDAAHVQDSKPFEEVKYMSEPVVTVAVEPDMLKNLNRLQEILEEIKIEDPNINFEISNESGECLLSGVGPLHLETIASSIKERGVDVSVSKPSSVFRESVANASKICSATSPNGLNQVEIIVKRNSDKTVAYLRTAKSQVLENEGIRAKELPLHTDLSPDDIKTISHIDKFQNTICLVKAEEETKSKDKMDLYRQIGEATQALIRKGILAQEPLSELLIIVKPLQLASNPDDANYFELSTMIQTAFMAAINDAVPILLEPIFTLMITTPEDLIGTVTSLVTQHLGRITEISQDPYRTFVHAKMSVRKSIEFSAEIRSETSGWVFWQTLFDSFQPVPDTQKDQIIQDIKFRKGLAFR